MNVEITVSQSDVRTTGQVFNIFDESDGSEHREHLGNIQRADDGWRVFYSTASWRLEFVCPTFPRALLAIEHIRAGDRVMRS